MNTRHTRGPFRRNFFGFNFIAHQEVLRFVHSNTVFVSSKILKIFLQFLLRRLPISVTVLESGSNYEWAT